ncbi:MAG: CotH kinase family protein [Bacteroidetes bacterium]|jgi:hypothetical protein|nr:CotH kinase family protein [Bacteroidota bacterium]
MKKLPFVIAILFFTHTLFTQDLYDINHIPEIRIEFAEAEWAKKLDELKRAGNKERLSASVSINGVKFNFVGVRYKGNSSYFNVQKSGSSKLPFNIKADYEIDGQKFPGGYKTLKLSNIFRDPSFVREALTYEIANKYMPSPKCNFAKVYVNDEYLGLYNNTESIDEKFLKEAFGKGKNTFVKCDPDWKVKQKEGCIEGEKASLMYLGDDPDCYASYYEMKKSKGSEGWEELVHLMEVLKNSPKDVDTLLNIDRVLWMHAFNNILVNLDSYTGRLSHNYYLYKTPDGLFTPLVWDMNLSFGGFRFDGISPRMLTDEDMQTMSPFVHYKTKNPKRPLIVNILANPLYRKIYVGHMRTILYDNFLNGFYEQRAKEIQQIIDVEVNNDNNKLYDYSSFQKNLSKTADAGLSKIIGITELMEKRSEYLANHPLLKVDPPSITDVQHLIVGDEVAFQATVPDAKKVYVFYRKGKKHPFKMLELFDEGATLDQMGGDQVYGNSTTYKKGMDYYIVAEGSRSASSSPKKASYEFHEVD